MEVQRLQHRVDLLARRPTGSAVVAPKCRLLKLLDFRQPRQIIAAREIAAICGRGIVTHNSLILFTGTTCAEITLREQSRLLWIREALRELPDRFHKISTSRSQVFDVITEPSQAKQRQHGIEQTCLSFDKSNRDRLKVSLFASILASPNANSLGILLARR